MYLTIKNNAENELIINKSRFICTIKRAETEEEAIEFIRQIRKKYNNANHNCYCYIVGEDSRYQKANDDGEPSSTAGIPMLEVLRKNHITDTVCVVTRYFGGIKLGASGLIRAYGNSVSDIIKEAGLVERKKMQVIKLTFDYSQIGLIETRLKDYILLDKSFLEKVQYEYAIPIDEVEKFTTYLIDITSDNITFESKDIIIHEVDYQ